MGNNADTILTWVKPLLALAEALRDVDSIDTAIAEKRMTLDKVTATEADFRQRVDVANAQLNDLKAQNANEVATHRITIADFTQEIASTLSAAQLQVDTMLTDTENRVMELKNSSDSELKKASEELALTLTQLDAARVDRDALLTETESLAVKACTLRETITELELAIQPQPQVIFRDP